jgi:hypothetical protein
MVVGTYDGGTGCGIDSIIMLNRDYYVGTAKPGYVPYVYPHPLVAPDSSTTYTLSVTKSGTGTGTVSGGSINCGSTCTTSVTSSAPVTLTATPASGSTFAGWSGGGCSGPGSCTMTMNANTSVTATFNPTVVTGNAYYVATLGSNSNPGTEAQPWLTIGHALGRITGGSTLYVKEGTYNEELYITGPSGTAGNPTTIRAYPGHTVILRGNGVHTGRNKIAGASYMTFDGFTMTNYNQGPFVESANNIVVQNCTIYGVGQEGLRVYLNSSYVTIDGCTVHDTRQWKYNGEGIYIGTGDSSPLDNTHHVIIRNSTIYNTPDEGIELKIGTHHVTVDGNTLYNVNLGSDWSQNGNNVGAIEVNHAVGSFQHYGSNPDHIIRNNIIHDVKTAIRAGTGSTIYNNVIWEVSGYGIYVDNASNESYTRFIYQNTIHAGSANAVFHAGGNQDVKNNIGPSTANNLPANPAYFVSVTKGSENYHLVSGAAPINAGVVTSITTDKDGVSRPQGPAWDIGAYEYNGDAPPDTTPPDRPRGLRFR